MKKEKNKKNSTKFGEFVCSEYQWLPIDKQKKQAENLAKMTEKNNKK